MLTMNDTSFLSQMSDSMGPLSSNSLPATSSLLDVDPLDPSAASDADTGYYTLVESILIAVIAGILSFVTIAGNVLVMVSFKLDKQLQTISNYFLLSLAVADFMIGLISMPLYTIYLLLNRWPLGPFICDAWLALDYLNSNASVLNLLIISFDRYFSVTRPLTYRVRRTTRRACLMIASTWIVSLLLWPPWIFAWPYIEGKRTVPDRECYIQFLETNLYITFGTALAAFYIPVTVMCFLYWRIWRETEKRYKDLTTLFLVSAVGSSKVSKSGNSSNKSAATIGSSSKGSRNRKKKIASATAAGDSMTSKSKSLRINLPSGTTSSSVSKGRSGRKLVTSRSTSRDPDDDDQNQQQEDPACRSHHSILHIICYPFIYIYDRFISRAIDVEDEEEEDEYDATADDEDEDDSYKKTGSGAAASGASAVVSRRSGNKDVTEMTSTTEEDENAFTDTDCDSSSRGGGTGSSSGAGGLASDSIYTILITLGIPGSGKAGPGSQQHHQHQPQHHINTPTTTSSAALTPIESDVMMIDPLPGQSYSSSCKSPTHLSIKQFFESAVIQDHGSGSDADGSNSPLSGTTSANRSRSGTNTNTRSAVNPAKTTTATTTASAATLTREQSTKMRPVIQSAISQPKAEKKAAKTLSAILLTFIITWTPYNVLVLIKTLAESPSASPFPLNGTDFSNSTSVYEQLDSLTTQSEPLISKTLYDFAYYLCYINSTINPMCYALCNVNFRNTYLRILRCQWTLRGTRAKRAAANLEAQFTHDQHVRSKKNKHVTTITNVVAAASMRKDHVIRTQARIPEQTA